MAQAGVLVFEVISYNFHRSTHFRANQLIIGKTFVFSFHRILTTQLRQLPVLITDQFHSLPSPRTHIVTVSQTRFIASPVPIPTFGANKCSLPEAHQRQGYQFCKLPNFFQVASEAGNNVDSIKICVKRVLKQFCSGKEDESKENANPTRNWLNIKTQIELMLLEPGFLLWTQWTVSAAVRATKAARFGPDSSTFAYPEVAPSACGETIKGCVEALTDTALNTEATK